MEALVGLNATGMEGARSASATGSTDAAPSLPEPAVVGKKPTTAAAPSLGAFAAERLACFAEAHFSGARGGCDPDTGKAEVAANISEIEVAETSAAGAGGGRGESPGGPNGGSNSSNSLGAQISEGLAAEALSAEEHVLHKARSQQDLVPRRHVLRSTGKVDNLNMGGGGGVKASSVKDSKDCTKLRVRFPRPKSLREKLCMLKYVREAKGKIVSGIENNRMKGTGATALANWEAYIFKPIRQELREDPDYIPNPREIFSREFTGAWQAWCESQKAQLRKQLAAAEGSRVAAPSAATTHAAKAKNRLQEARKGNLATNNKSFMKKTLMKMAMNRDARRARVHVPVPVLANGWKAATQSMRLANPANGRQDGGGRGKRAVPQRQQPRPIGEGDDGACVFVGVGKRGDEKGSSRLSSDEGGGGNKRARSGGLAVPSHHLFRRHLSTLPEPVRPDTARAPSSTLAVGPSSGSFDSVVGEAWSKGKGKLRAEAGMPLEGGGGGLFGAAVGGAGLVDESVAAPQASFASEQNHNNGAGSNISSADALGKVAPLVMGAKEIDALCGGRGGAPGESAPAWTIEEKAAHNLRLAQLLNSLREQGSTEIDQAQIVKIALGSYVP